jgi:hypothetical protein
MGHTSVVGDSLPFHGRKRHRVLVARGIEPLDVLGIFELAILIESTLVRVRWRRHIKRSTNEAEVQ